jgi:opacity protein-like surface antigen
MAILMALLALMSVSAFAQAHELAITAGGNFPSNDQFNPGNSFVVGGQYDGRIFHVPLVALYLDVPLVVATNSSFREPSIVNVRNSYRSFFFTPGLKVRFGAPLVPVAPYVVAGVGFAHYNTNNDVLFGNNSSTNAAWSIGGGLDMKVAPFFSIRGEVRDFISGTPDIAAITQSGRTHNVVPQVGLVFRF